MQLFLLAYVLTTSTLVFSHSLKVNQQCFDSCDQYSKVLYACYNDEHPHVDPAIQGYDEANKFVACLCVGNTSDGSSGADTFQQTADFCGGCSTTPERIREDIADLLALCKTQSSNGTASAAQKFVAIPYAMITNLPETPDSP